MLPNYQKLSRYLRASEGDYNATLEDLGIDPHKVKDSLRGGLADAKSYTDFPLDQLERGIKVEMEHTDDPYVALEISMDHLTEDRKYYTKLDKMEKGSKVKISQQYNTNIDDASLSVMAKELFKILVDEYESSGEYPTLEYEDDSERVHYITPYFEYLEDTGDIVDMIKEIANGLGYDVDIDKEFINRIYEKMFSIYNKPKK